MTEKNTINKHNRRMYFRHSLEGLVESCQSRRNIAFILRGGPYWSKKSISLRKQEIKFMHILKEMSFVCYGPFHTIHLHPGFSSFPCPKTSTQSNHLHPFPCSHNCTLFHNALSVPPPPFSLRLTHAAVKCREYTQMKGFFF